MQRLPQQVVGHGNAGLDKADAHGKDEADDAAGPFLVEADRPQAGVAVESRRRRDRQSQACERVGEAAGQPWARR